MLIERLFDVKLSTPKPQTRHYGRREEAHMCLGRVRIGVGILAALTMAVAVGTALHSPGKAAARSPRSPLALTTAATSSPAPAAARSTTPRRQAVDVNSLRAQWLDAEQKIRAAGATTSQQEQQAIPAKNGPAITTALNQEIAALGAQDRRIAGLPWPPAMRTDIDAFESSTAAALNQLRSAASNPFGYDAAQVNAAIAGFNAAVNAVRRDLGLPPD
jgi:hypothetical protein